MADNRLQQFGGYYAPDSPLLRQGGIRPPTWQEQYLEPLAQFMTGMSYDQPRSDNAMAAAGMLGGLGGWFKRMFGPQAFDPTRRTIVTKAPVAAAGAASALSGKPLAPPGLPSTGAAGAAAANPLQEFLAKGFQSAQEMEFPRSFLTNPVALLKRPEDLLGIGREAGTGAYVYTFNTANGPVHLTEDIVNTMSRYADNPKSIGPKLYRAIFGKDAQYPYPYDPENYGFNIPDEVWEAGNKRVNELALNLQAEKLRSMGIPDHIIQKNIRPGYGLGELYQFHTNPSEYFNSNMYEYVPQSRIDQLIQKVQSGQLSTADAEKIAREIDTFGLRVAAFREVGLDDTEAKSLARRYRNERDYMRKFEKDFPNHPVNLELAANRRKLDAKYYPFRPPDFNPTQMELPFPVRIQRDPQLSFPWHNHDFGRK